MSHDELVSVLQSESARRLLYEIIEECGVFAIAPVEQQTAACFEGRRRVGLDLMHRILSVDEGRFGGEMMRQIVDRDQKYIEDR